MTKASKWYFKLYAAAKHFEPWGILIALLAFLLSLAGFWFDYEARVEARTINAWTLLTTKATGNSGKISALEYLNAEDGLLCSTSGCTISLKKRAPLPALNLSGTEEAITHLSGVKLPNALLQTSRLSFVNLTGADLSGANLRGVDLTRSILRGANLTNANLEGAIMHDVQLNGANLTGAILHYATIQQNQLIGACGDESTELALPSQTIEKCPSDWKAVDVNL